MFGRCFPCLAATLAILSACSETPTTPLLAPGSLIASADRTVKLVPFKASQTQTPGDPSGIACPAGETPGLATAEGTGTHLGNFTSVVITCVNGPAGVWSRVDGTFTAANGDQLEIEMDAVNFARVIFFDPSTGDFISAGGLNVVGGTGRFDGATGSMTFRSTGNVFLPGALTTLVGEISSPGSIKWGTP